MTGLVSEECTQLCPGSLMHVLPTLLNPASSVGGSQGQQEARLVGVVLGGAKDGPLFCGHGLVNVGAVLIGQRRLRCVPVQLRVWSRIYSRNNVNTEDIMNRQTERRGRVS